MMVRVYSAMAIPESCRLEKRIYKKLFYEHGKLGAADKAALRDDVESILWQYTLKPTTIPIHPYEDQDREYLEVAVLQVNLKKAGRVQRLAGVIHRAIPYPLVVLFVCGKVFWMSLAHKRYSQADKEAIVAEDFQGTGWIDPENPEGVQVDFLRSLDIRTWPHTHFFEFYKAAAARVAALECAGLTGYFLLREWSDVEEYRKILERCRELESRMGELRGAIKKEGQFNRQVELNMEIKELEQEFGRLMKGLQQ